MIGLGPHFLARKGIVAMTMIALYALCAFCAWLWWAVIGRGFLYYLWFICILAVFATIALK